MGFELITSKNVKMAKELRKLAIIISLLSLFIPLTNNVTMIIKYIVSILAFFGYLCTWKTDMIQRALGLDEEILDKIDGAAALVVTQSNQLFKARLSVVSPLLPGLVLFTALNQVIYNTDIYKLSNYLISNSTHSLPLVSLVSLVIQLILYFMFLWFISKTIVVDAKGLF